MNSSQDKESKNIDEDAIKHSTDDSLMEDSAALDDENNAVNEGDPQNDATADDINESEENKLQNDFDQLQEKYLRLSAELDNVQKRARQEMENTRKFAIKGFASELLSVKDSLELATNIELSTQTEAVVTNMHKGLELTLKQLNQVFEKFDIEEVAPQVGDKLDPEIHQAMSMQETDEYEANSIMTVFQKGYRLSGRLIRPAMVVVAKKANG